jgi:acetylornithine deacetylase/succinyl-diaminopimelate desuccinylase-like protein
MESDCRTDFDRIAKEESERGCTLHWKLLTSSPGVNFHPDCIAAVEASAIETCGDWEAAASGKKEGKLWKHMTSGAGHDSCYTSMRVPTSMIFVPCKDGISHNPEEFCSLEDWYISSGIMLTSSLARSEHKFCLEQSYDMISFEQNGGISNR